MRAIACLVIILSGVQVFGQKAISAKQFLREIDQKEQYSKVKELNDEQYKRFIAENAELILNTTVELRDKINKSNLENVYSEPLNFSKQPKESLEALINRANRFGIEEASIVQAALDATKNNVGNQVDGTTIKINPLKIGLGVGVNQSLDRIKEVTYSPVDSIVYLRKVKRTSFVISSTFSFEIFSGARKVRNADHTDSSMNPDTNKLDRVEKIISKGQMLKQFSKDGTPTYLFKPNGWNLLLSINLATFESAATKAPEFNLRINGGIGIGYSINSHVQVGLLAEFTQRRQPYNHFKDLKGQKLDESYPNSVLTLDKTDDNLYFTDYVPSLSLKIIILPFELFKER